MASILTDRFTVAPTSSESWLGRFFLRLVLLQGFHFFEHCVQLVQRFLFDDPNGNGHLGNLANFEPLHFGYNSPFLAGVLWVYAGVSLASRPAGSRRGLVMGLLAAAVSIQGYHEMEHLLRVGQVLGWLNVNASAAGSEPPGLLGQWFNGTLVHWALNGCSRATATSDRVTDAREPLLLATV